CTGERARRLGRERRGGALERPELRAQLEQRGVRVAGADLAGVAQLVAVVVADEQRAEPDPAALGVGEPADHELLAQQTLGLDPGGAAARSIRLIAPLGDDALEAALARQREELGAAA